MKQNYKIKTSDYIDIHNEMNFMIEKEFYRYIPGFPNYRVSNYADIKNDEKDKYITPILQGGYYQVNLCYNNKLYMKKFHQIMILAFYGEPPHFVGSRRLPSNKHTVEP